MATAVPTLKQLAEMGYTMGLSTIGEVEMLMRYAAYWVIEEALPRTAELAAVVEGHETDSIGLYLSAEDRARLDAELDAALAVPPGAPADDPL
jgi:hypothetical protein